VGWIPDILRSPFSFLFARPQKEQLVAEYIIREHHSGRPLEEVVRDAYVTNRVDPNHLRRIFDRPEVVHALGDDVIRSFEATATS
jgi:hypothetical protein